MAKCTHDIVITTGEYTDAEGNTKKRYHNIGVIFTNEKGQMSMKFDSLPCGPNWSGFASLYPKEDKPRQEPQQRQGQPAQPQGNQHKQGGHPMPPPRTNMQLQDVNQPQGGGNIMENEDIPF